MYLYFLRSDGKPGQILCDSKPTPQRSTIMAKTKNKPNGFHHFGFCEVGERVSLSPGLAGCCRKHTQGTIFLATENRPSLEEFAAKHGFPYYEVMVDSPDPFRIPTRRIYIENKPL